jgi:hypothetical protein
MPTQMPRKGTPARWLRGWRGEAGRVEIVCGGEVADAGKHDALGGFDGGKVGVGDFDFRAEMTQRLEHRGQIARFVVDDGYAHQSNPLVEGSMSAELLVARAGYAQRAGKGFEDGFDLVMIGAAVHGLHVDVGARAASEALEEIGDELGLQIADQTRAHLGVNGKAARPLRSTAAMARVSSMGMRKYPARRMPRLSPSARSKASPSAMPTSSTVWC